MGSSQSAPSASASAPPPREGTFGVRFSPDLLDGAAGQLPAGAAAAPSGSEAQDQLQSAYQQGLEHGAQAQQAQQADEIHRHQAAQLSALEASNAEKEAALAGRIEELKNRDYRPPLQPMQCKDEREAVLACYRANRGATAGDLVFACQPNVVELEKCATLLREAAIAKIVPGSLPS